MKRIESTTGIFVAELCRLGIPKKGIAIITGLTESIVGKYIGRMQIREKIKKGRPTGKAAFQNILSLYANIRTTCREDTIFMAGKRSISINVALAQWIGEADILSDLCGVACTLRKLAVPHHTEEQVYVVRLATVVFKWGNRALEIADPDVVWRKILEGMQDIRPQNIPVSSEALKDEVLSQFITDHRDMIAPIWPSDINSIVQRALANIPLRMQIILALRYAMPASVISEDGQSTVEGFTKKPTLRNIGGLLNISRERVRQIEVDAILKLRHPANPFNFLRQTTTQWITKTVRKIEWQEKTTALESRQENASTPPRMETLLTPTAELKLSARAGNMLTAGEIHCIGDFVQKTEDEILEYRNFGRKSLNEVKEVLHEIDQSLELGMKLDPETAREFAEQRALDFPAEESI